MIDELQMVTKQKFPHLMKALDEFFQSLPFELVYTPRNDAGDVPEMRDEKDIPILSTAIKENVDLFMAGDKDFLVLEIDQPEIMTMSQFEENYISK